MRTSPAGPVLWPPPLAERKPGIAEHQQLRGDWPRLVGASRSKPQVCTYRADSPTSPVLVSFKNSSVGTPCRLPGNVTGLVHRKEAWLGDSGMIKRCSLCLFPKLLPGSLRGALCYQMPFPAPPPFFLCPQFPAAPCQKAESQNPFSPSSLQGTCFQIWLDVFGISA